MNLLLLLDMAASSDDRVAVQVGDDRLTAAELLSCAWAAAEVAKGADALAYVGTNHLAFPIGLFAAAAAGVPFVPLNYRLSEDQLQELLAPLGTTTVIAGGPVGAALAARGHQVVDPDDLVARARAGAAVGDVPDDSESTAVLLYTSGTTAAPKAAVLRHRHLTSYVFGTVEFAGAEPTDAALVSVPPYHVAGLANLLSNLFLGRRIAYLSQFDAAEWVRAAQAEQVTSSMVVPTMLSRICDELEQLDGGLPHLRSLAYGGAKTPAPVLQRAMGLLPHVDFTNAYGLTETSSTIAVLGPEDHRAALAGDPVAVERLTSVGKVLPSIEVAVRDDGEIWVRGEQVSGEYAGLGSRVDADGWFPTRDRGWVDDDGYLFIEGRADDTIIRGGENIAPAEIEAVLCEHADVAECAVVGIPDDEWGQVVAVAVVPTAGSTPDAAALQEHVRARLRGSKTPAVVRFVDALPYTETGKLLRRTVQADLTVG